MVDFKRAGTNLGPLFFAAIFLAYLLMISSGCGPGPSSNETDLTKEGPIPGDEEESASSDSTDTTAPLITLVSPASDASQVSVDSPIQVTFSEEVDPTSINGSTLLVSEVTGTVSSSGQTATFTPSSPLDHDRTYTATVTTGVLDLAGNSLETDYIWSFTTSSPGGGALGSASLLWAAPTTNDDGSTLSDLAGFRIYYGTSPGNHPNQIEIQDPGATTHQIDNLPADTYYFVMTAYDSFGSESTQSNMLSLTLN